MKIAIVSDAWLPQVNGVVTTLLELRDRLAAFGHDAFLVEPAQFRCVRCPGYGQIGLALWPGRTVARLLDAARPDAIHLATEGPLGLAGRRYCRRRGLPFTTAFHTRFPEFLEAMFGVPARWGYAVLRRFHAASAGVMVPSAGSMNILRGHRFPHLRAWSHGIDLELFRPWPRPPRSSSGPVFLFVGRIAVEKNIEAFLRLDLPGRKVVCGDGPLLQRYRRDHPEVEWVGVVPRQRLVHFYNTADVFVFPSRTDTFGLVMLEAMACGTPVAAFPVPGPLDVVGSSGGGVLDEDLASAAMRALSLPRAGARARAETFDADRSCREFVSFLAPLAHACRR